MHFTREPIIETVITPREGCKLLVRSTKATGQEEYHVEAVEVVSFGHSFFFRSLEKTKTFLVPVSDYEVLELRETRMVLKNAPQERSIKIGGGRDAPVRTSREPEHQPQEARSEESSESQPTDSHPSDRRPGGRRNRRGRRGRDRYPQDQQHSQHPRSPEEAGPSTAEGSEMIAEGAPLSEEVKAPSFISKLFPPPPTLIKETLGRYKHPSEAVETENNHAPTERPTDEFSDPQPPFEE